MSSPRRQPPRLSRRFSVPFALAAFALVTALAVLPGSASAIWTLNQALFDDGTCGHSTPLGIDPNTISTATPSILLYGDGNRSSYRIFIDGVAIGTFGSDTKSNVCILPTVPLSEGPHLLTGNELAPKATGAVTAFSFSVDTVPPAAPATPTLG